MKLYMCTLFDSYYLDKGLALHESLITACKEFELYILPMDEKCAQILHDLKLKNVTVLDYFDFEDEDLKKIKAERSRAEFCWTCTAKEIRYILDKYDIPFCTYIDSDLFFFDEPSVLIEEMIENGDDVQIVRHNFQSFEAEENERSAGKYCVEFNTFNNNENGRRVLKKWEADCVHDCSYGKSDQVMGDQKYLQSWPDEYAGINVTENQGAGVAPWNVNKFKYEIKEGKYIIIDSESGAKYNLVFYHFQNLVFLDDSRVRCCLIDEEIEKDVREIYGRYLRALKTAKDMVKDTYGIDFIIKIHPADRESRKVEKTKREKIKEKGIIRYLNGVIHGKRSMYIHNKHYSKRRELIINLEDL